MVWGHVSTTQVLLLLVLLLLMLLVAVAVGIVAADVAVFLLSLSVNPLGRRPFFTPCLSRLAFVCWCPRERAVTVGYVFTWHDFLTLLQGFDMIGSGRHKIETPEQFASSKKVMHSAFCTKLSGHACKYIVTSVSRPFSCFVLNWCTLSFGAFSLISLTPTDVLFLSLSLFS